VTQTEQRTDIKIEAKSNRNAAESYGMLTNTYNDEIMSCLRMCEWQKRVLATTINKSGLLKPTKTDANIRSSKSGGHGSEFKD
jgi:hypothetical protein